MSQLDNQSSATKEPSPESIALAEAYKVTISMYKEQFEIDIPVRDLKQLQFDVIFDTFEKTVNITEFGRIIYEEYKETFSKPPEEEKKEEAEDEENNEAEQMEGGHREDSNDEEEEEEMSEEELMKIQNRFIKDVIHLIDVIESVRQGGESYIKWELQLAKAVKPPFLEGQAFNVFLQAMLQAAIFYKNEFAQPNKPAFLDLEEETNEEITDVMDLDLYKSKFWNLIKVKKLEEDEEDEDSLEKRREEQKEMLKEVIKRHYSELKNMFNYYAANSLVYPNCSHEQMDVIRVKSNRELFIRKKPPPKVEDAKEEGEDGEKPASEKPNEEKPNEEKEGESNEEKEGDSDEEAIDVSVSEEIFEELYSTVRKVDTAGINRLQFIHLLVLIAKKKYIDSKIYENLYEAVELFIQKDILSDNDTYFGQEFTNYYLYNNEINKIVQEYHDNGVIAKIFKGNPDEKNCQMSLKTLENVMSLKYPLSLVRLCYAKCLRFKVEDNQIHTSKVISYAQFKQIIAHMGYQLRIKGRGPDHQIKMLLIYLNNQMKPVYKVKSEKVTFLRLSCKHCLENYEYMNTINQKKCMKLEQFFKIVGNIFRLTKVQFYDLEKVLRNKGFVQPLNNNEYIKEFVKGLSYIDIMEETPEDVVGFNENYNNLYKDLEISINDKEAIYQLNSQYDIKNLLPLVLAGQTNNNFIQTLFKMQATYRNQLLILKNKDALLKLVKQVDMPCDEMIDIIEKLFYQKVTRASNYLWTEKGKETADGLKQYVNLEMQKAIENEATQKLLKEGHIDDVKAQYEEEDMEKHIQIQLLTLARLSEELQHAMQNINSDNNQYDIAKLMLIAIQNYTFIVSPCGAQYHDKCNYEQLIEQELVTFTKAFQAQLNQPYHNIQKQLNNNLKQNDKKIKETIKKLNSKKNTISSNALSEDLLQYYLNLANEMDLNLDLTDPLQAVVYLNQTMGTWNIQWIENMLKNMPKEYYRFSFDTQYDLIQLKDKVIKLKEQNQNQYGWQFVKDFVQCTFYFTTADELYECFDHFAKNPNNAKYSIIDVQNQINSPQHYISLIVYNHHVKTSGEIILKLQAKQIPPAINFLNDWLAEIRQIYKEAKLNCPEHWTQKLKTQRTKEYSIVLQKLVLKVFSQGTAASVDKVDQYVQVKAETKDSQVNTHCKFAIDYDEMTEDQNFASLNKTIKVDLPDLAAGIRRPQQDISLQLKEEIMDYIPTQKIMKEFQKAQNQQLLQQIGKLKNQMNRQGIMMKEKQQIQEKMQFLQNITLQKIPQDKKIEQYITNSFTKHFQKVNDKFISKLEQINNENEFKEYRFKAKVKEFESIVKSLKKQMDIQNRDINSQLGVLKDVYPQPNYLPPHQHLDEIQDIFTQRHNIINNLMANKVNQQSSKQSLTSFKSGRSYRSSKSSSGRGSSDSLNQQNTGNDANLFGLTKLPPFNKTQYGRQGPNIDIKDCLMSNQNKIQNESKNKYRYTTPKLLTPKPHDIQNPSDIRLPAFDDCAQYRTQQGKITMFSLAKPGEGKTPRMFNAQKTPQNLKAPNLFKQAASSTAVPPTLNINDSTKKLKVIVANILRNKELKKLEALADEQANIMPQPKLPSTLSPKFDMKKRRKTTFSKNSKL